MFFRIFMSLLCGLAVFDSVTMEHKYKPPKMSTKSNKKVVKSWGAIEKEIQEVIIRTLHALMNIKDKTSPLDIRCQKGKVSRLQHIIDRHQANTEKRPKIEPDAIPSREGYASQAANVLVAISDVARAIVGSAMLNDPKADVWLTEKLKGDVVELQVAISMPPTIKVPILCPVQGGKWKILEARSFCLQFIMEAGGIRFSSAYFQPWKENEAVCLCGCGSKTGHDVSDERLQLPDYVPLPR